VLLPALWLLEVPVFASTWRAGSEAEIGLCSAFALAPGARLLLWRHAEEFVCAPRTLTSQPDHGETAEPEDANNALRPKAGLPRWPGSHPLLAHERVSRAAPTRSTGGRLALPVRPARDSLGGDCRNSSERKPARPPTRVSLLSNLRSPSRIPPGFCIPGKRPWQPRTRRRPAGPSQLRLVTRLRFAWCGLKCGLHYGLNS